MFLWRSPPLLLVSRRVGSLLKRQRNKRLQTSLYDPLILSCWLSPVLYLAPFD
jgi:hypothetical protein